MASEVVCAEAHGVIHSTSGKKGCKDEMKNSHVYLVEKDGSYSLDFYKYPRDVVKQKVKCSHMLELPGHNFIITAHETDSIIFDIFSLRETSPRAFLTIKVRTEQVPRFSESLKDHLEAFSHVILVIDNQKEILCVLHVTSRRICITTAGANNAQFILEPKKIDQIGVEIKHGMDAKSYELRIHSLQYLNDDRSFIIKSSSCKDVYGTLKKMNLISDIDFEPDIYEKNGYGKIPRKGARIYTYVDTQITQPSPSSSLDSPTYEYIKLPDDATRVPVEVKELVYEGKKTTTKNDLLNCHVSLFHSKPDFAHTLCLYVIFTASSDRESFQRLKDLEVEAGRIMLIPCRDLTTRSDIQLNWPQVDGFTFYSEMSELVSYDALKQLKAGQSWVVVEAHAKYTGEKVQSKEFFARLQINSVDDQKALQKITPIIVFNEKEKKILTPPLHISSDNDDVFPLPCDKRMILCNKLDTIHPLHQDWKMFAHYMGLSKDTIDLIGSKPCNSYTQEVIKSIVTTNPERCTIDYLKDVFDNKMERKDILSVIISCSEEGASEHDG